MTKIVGIDLGTTFSAVAHINENGVPELIPNEDGDQLTPSVILYEEGEFVVGEYAKHHARAVPDQIVEFVKRYMGKPIAEFSREFGGKEYSAEELSAEILKTLKKDAETKLSEQITDAVITVPAYFNDPERQATIRAGEIAGLNVRRIVNEPTAAALCYGIHRGSDTSKVLVFDLGGGTFDVTIMEVKGQEMTVLATDGDHKLGGKDWDDKIIEYVADTFQIEHGDDPLEDSYAYQDLQLNAIRVKEHLSTTQRARIVCNYNGNGSIVEVTRGKFEEITTHLVERCKSTVNIVLDEIGLTKDQIDTVLLVGGSTRLPMIQNMLTEHFGKPPDTSVNPDEAVVFGAAVMGELIQSEETKKRSFIGGASKVPKQSFGIMRISDVCSHSLGMVALDDIGELKNSVIIQKNTNIPCEVSNDNFKTTSSNQTEIDVIVLQGDENLDPRDCTVRDAYEVFDIPPRPPGETRIKVTFKYDVNGVIEVEAEDVDKKKVLPIRKKEGEIDWDAYETPEAVAMPIDIALVIDCSGSMYGDKLSDAKKAAIRFLDDIDPSFQVGLVSFQTQAKLEMNLTEDFSELSQTINNLSAGGGNNDEGAIAIARDQVLVNSQNMKVLVLLADGRPTDMNAMLREADHAKQQDIQLIAIGVGDDVDSNLLKQVASTPEDYYFVEESVQLESTFTTIASRLVTEYSGRGAGFTR